MRRKDNEAIYRVSLDSGPVIDKEATKCDAARNLSNGGLNCHSCRVLLDSEPIIDKEVTKCDAARNLSNGARAVTAVEFHLIVG